MRREYNIILVKLEEQELDYEALGLETPEDSFTEKLAPITIDMSKVDFYYSFTEKFHGKDVEAIVVSINGRLTPTLLISYEEFKEHLENESNHASIKT